MKRVFRLNALFEEELAGIPGITPASANIQYWLEHIFHLLAGPDDTVITSHPLPEELAEKWQAAGFYPATGTEIAGRQLVEWGSASVLSGSTIVRDNEKLELSRRLNSKIVQARWKIDNRIPAAPLQLCSPANLGAFIHRHGYPVILKPAFTTAGRGFRILVSPATPVGTLPSVFVAEKWLTRKSDHSLLVDIDRGNITVLAATEMIISPRGGFNGLVLDTKTEQNHIKEYIQSFPELEKYSGPASVDWFRCNDGKIRVSEINFRYTMGRVLLELQKKSGRKGTHALVFADKAAGNPHYTLPLTPQIDLKGKVYPKKGYYLVYDEKYSSHDISKILKVNDF